MEKKYLIIALSLLMPTLLSFKVGEEIDIIADFLNARSSANFLKSTPNIKTTLAKGTTGEILEVKDFSDKAGKSSGNAGLKIKVSSGPKAGQSYWVYYNKDNPAIKLIEGDTKKEIPLARVSLDIDKPSIGQVLRDIPAIRAAEVPTVEQNLVSTARMVNKLSHGVDIPIIEADCPKEEISEATYSPEAALADLNSGELKFIGRDLMPGSGQNRTCVFKNNKVYVLYDNCMSSKKESVMDMRIISANGESNHFYMEDFKGRNTSSMKREEYAGTWRVSYNKVERPADMDMTQVKKYLEDINSSTNGCWVGGNLSEAPSKADCYGEFKSKLPSWGPSAESFWNKPTDAWYVAQQKMRKSIQAARF